MLWPDPFNSRQFMTMLHVIHKISRLMAYLGGVMLIGLIVMTTLSILGRSLNGVLHGDMMQTLSPSLANGLIEAGVGPLMGDYELLQAGMAFSIFAFLPLCQIHGAHASVDVFTSRMPPKVNVVMVWISELVFALVLMLIAWQLSHGFLDKYRSGETTFLLQFPVWWAYGLSLIAAVIAAVVAAVMAMLRSAALISGTALIIPEDNTDGAEH